MCYGYGPHNQNWKPKKKMIVVYEGATMYGPEYHAIIKAAGSRPDATMARGIKNFLEYSVPEDEVAAFTQRIAEGVINVFVRSKVEVVEEKPYVRKPDLYFRITTVKGDVYFHTSTFSEDVEKEVRWIRDNGFFPKDHAKGKVYPDQIESIEWIRPEEPAAESESESEPTHEPQPTPPPPPPAAVTQGQDLR